VHDRSYVDRIASMSDDHTKGIHRVGDESAFAPGGFEIAALSAGGAIVATDEVLSGARRFLGRVATRGRAVAGGGPHDTYNG
jgi:acetoin utilization deacetylase AcuC-like enzyme